MCTVFDTSVVCALSFCESFGAEALSPNPHRGFFFSCPPTSLYTTVMCLFGLSSWTRHLAVLSYTNQFPETLPSRSLQLRRPGPTYRYSSVTPFSPFGSAGTGRKERSPSGVSTPLPNSTNLIKRDINNPGMKSAKHTIKSNP